MSTSAVTLRWPQRARRSTIQAGVCALRVHAAHDAAREAAAQVGAPAPPPAGAGRAPAGTGGMAGVFKRRAGQRRDLARDAVDAERMRQVGRELEREDGVVELQPLADVGAQRRVGGQLEQAAVVVGDLQFARRAQHAAALDAAQLADADLEGLAVLAGRQLGADHGQRHLEPGARIGRAADDLQRLAGRRMLTWHTRSRSACGCGSALRISATTTPLNGGATGRRSSTSMPDIVSRSASCCVDSGGLQNSRNQDSGNCMAAVDLRSVQRRSRVGATSVQLNCVRKRRSPSKNRRRSSMP